MEWEEVQATLLAPVFAGPLKERYGRASGMP